MFAGNDIGNVTPILEHVKSHLAQNRAVTRLDVAREFRHAYRTLGGRFIEERCCAPMRSNHQRVRKSGFGTWGRGL